MNPFEKVRKSYKPKEIKILYIAESRPANGTFFYLGNSNLYNAIKEAFEQAYDRNFSSSKSFLDFFKEKNCYLEDLCREPVNKFPNNERRRKRKDGISRLAESIKKSKPTVIIILMMGILDDVHQAIEKSGIEIKYGFATPFPAHSSKNIDNCINNNIEILNQLKQKSVIN